MSKAFFTHYKTPYGTGVILFDREGVFYVALPTPAVKDFKKRLKSLYPEISYEKEKGKFFKIKLEKYFEGEKVLFNFPLNLRGFSQLEKKVYSIVRRIGYGKRKSYSWVAERADTSPRVVGRILSKNPVPVVVPCHRVVRKDGSLGGFLAGIGWKRKLLDIEKSLILVDRE